jgi:hypothetical protein
MIATADHVVRIRDQLGPCVSLAIAPGEKRPRTTGHHHADGDEGSPGVQENGFGRNCFYAGSIRYDTVSGKKHLQGRGGTKSTHRGSAKGTHRGRGEKHPEFITMGGLRWWSLLWCK